MSDLALTFFEALQAAGVPHDRELATRGDVEKIRAEITKVEANLIKWLSGIGIATVLTLYGLLKV
jgi:hypothetical protein